MKHRRTFFTMFTVLFTIASLASVAAAPTQGPKYDLNTLAGKVAAVNGTQGLQIRFSAFIEEEAQLDQVNTSPTTAIEPTYVLSSKLDGTSIQAPEVTVNQDTHAAPQNETAVAVDPNNSQRVVVGANDYVSRTWDCMIDGTPCSALGDGYSGTYYSNDGGQTWAGVSTGPDDLGTLIPGVTRLAGGPYDAGGDPALAFDSQGNVYYAGLGFNRASAPNTVTVNKGIFDSSGALTWSQPVFINATTSPAVFNDKEWIAADSHAGSPFQDRVYVSWTIFNFSPITGAYVKSPIAFSFSDDGGQTFSSPQTISDNVLYGQGSRPVVGPDGTVYVFWDGSTRLAAFDSIYMVKSSDGGQTWSKPQAVSELVDITNIQNTVFRVNSFPAAAVAPNGDLYVAWTHEQPIGVSDYTVDSNCADWIAGYQAVINNCFSATAYSVSHDGGETWSPTPSWIFPDLNASSRTAEGYPIKKRGKVLLAAPPDHPVDTVWPGVSVSPEGDVYMSAYGADVVSPWQLCKTPASGAAGRIDCLELGDYVHNARLDYYVTNLSSRNVAKVSTHPINTRHGFGGGFIGDYTDLAVGSDGAYHAVWTDTNNAQDVTWWYGYEFVPTSINQQDVGIASGTLP